MQIYHWNFKFSNEAPCFVPSTPIFVEVKGVWRPFAIHICWRIGAQTVCFWKEHQNFNNEKKHMFQQKWGFSLVLQFENGVVLFQKGCIELWKKKMKWSLDEDCTEPLGFFLPPLHPKWDFESQVLDPIVTSPPQTSILTKQLLSNGFFEHKLDHAFRRWLDAPCSSCENMTIHG